VIAVWRALVAALVVVGVLAGVARAQEQKLHVIVNPSNAVASMSLEEVKACFLGEKTFWSGQRAVTPIGRPEGAEAGKLLYKTILRMTPARFRHHWTGLELSGRAVAPNIVAKPEDVALLVQGNPGAISVVTTAELEVLKKFRVKRLPIVVDAP
jgi:ABC-type phosphate transport system substrate-binding protein